MKPLGNTARHVLLVNGMARAVGADLTAVEQDDYADMVQRCRGCAEPGRCEGLLRSVEGARETPGYCRNADVLARLVP